LPVCQRVNPPNPNPPTNPNPSTSGCNYSAGQFLLNFYGEAIYAHQYNGYWYAAYQDGSNFKPRHWLVAAGFDANQSNCFAEDDPRNGGTNPPSNPTPPSSGDCSVSNPQGHVDAFFGDGIYGWALDANDLNKTVMVDVYINGEKVATIPADEDRSDLVNSYNNAAARYHGFSMAISNLTYSPKSYNITIQICGSSSPLGYNPVTVSARKPGDPAEDPACTETLPEVVVKAKKTKWGYPVCRRGGSSGTGTSGGDSGNPPGGEPGTPGNPIDTPGHTTNPGSGSDPNNSGSNPSFPSQLIPTTGDFEGMDCEKISGWAFANGGGYAYLDIYVANIFGQYTKAATIKANQMSRPDVQGAYGNNVPLDCGFMWEIPTQYRTGHPLTIAVMPVNNPNAMGTRTTSGDCSNPTPTNPGGPTDPPIFNPNKDLCQSTARYGYPRNFTDGDDDYLGNGVAAHYIIQTYYKQLHPYEDV
jgi:hypothetical protein